MVRNDERIRDAAFLLEAMRPGSERRTTRRALRELVHVHGGIAPLRSAAERGEVEGASHLAAVAAAIGPTVDAIHRFLARPERALLLADDPGFPPLLAETSDSPLLLFLRGGDPAELAGLPLPIAVVGARRATPYGLEAARHVAGDLATAGATVVSGLARGIDGEAHRATLAAKGRTVAVLGCGVDVDYPKEHARLAEEIAGSGGFVVSELPPGAPPHARHFPERNRIIAGLARGVVVVEAAIRSGSLSTARHALDDGREVWAVPGSVFSPTSAGCLALLRDGARAAGSAADVLADLPGELLCELAALAPRLDAPRAPVPAWLASALSPELVRGIDEIASRTGRAVGEVLQSLAEAELAGSVRSFPGGQFLLVKKPASSD